MMLNLSKSQHKRVEAQKQPEKVIPLTSEEDLLKKVFASDGYANDPYVRELLRRYEVNKEELERWKLGTHLLLNPEGQAKK